MHQALMTVEARGYEVLIALLRADLRSTDRGLQRLHLADDCGLWLCCHNVQYSLQDL